MDLAQLKPVFKLVSIGTALLAFVLMLPLGFPVNFDPGDLFLASIASHFLSE